jgi:hypothetical protein
MRTAILAFTAALMAAPALGQPSGTALDPGLCERLPASIMATPPNLQGVWDFTMETGERDSRGFMALGPVDDAWAGSLTPYATNSLAIRKLSLDGAGVKMVVASREGDVVFTGRLAGEANMMCGTVNYHGGRVIPMIARLRPGRAYSPGR